MSEPLLSVRGLSISAGAGAQRVSITTGTDLALGRGETLAIVGESGSGKSLTARAIARLLPPGVSAEGSVHFDGHDVLRLPESQMQRLRGRRIALILQDPFTMMNPLMRAGAHIEEMLARRPEFAGRGARAQEMRRRLAEVGITDEDVAHRMPFQLSGGMCQRVAVARALAVGPKILVCDEPVSALDVSVQAQILNLFKRLQEEHGLSYLFITHDLAVVRQVVDRLYVLYLGEIVESGPTEAVMSHPQHPYTRRLIDSIPRSAAAGRSASVPPAA